MTYNPYNQNQFLKLLRQAIKTQDGNTLASCFSLFLVYVPLSNDTCDQILNNKNIKLPPFAASSNGKGDAEALVDILHLHVESRLTDQYNFDVRYQLQRKMIALFEGIVQRLLLCVCLCVCVYLFVCLFVCLFTATFAFI